MKERDMQTIWGKYIVAHPPESTEVYELKFTREKRVSFDALQTHQLEALLKSETSRGLYHRITDQPWMPDRPYSYTLKKPCDCFIVVKAKAFVVVWFFKPRQQKAFWKIEINKFLEMRQATKFKSFTEQDCQQFGELVFMDIPTVTIL